MRDALGGICAYSSLIVRGLILTDGTVANVRYQTELETLDKTDWKDSSFISEFWFDTYLNDRKCLPINYNPEVQ